ncbi:hypothetical protein [Carp edema virus]|nr:hypothetical protein [Carp edema virus]
MASHTDMNGSAEDSTKELLEEMTDFQESDHEDDSGTDGDTEDSDDEDSLNIGSQFDPSSEIPYEGVYYVLNFPEQLPEMDKDAWEECYLEESTVMSSTGTELYWVSIDSKSKILCHPDLVGKAEEWRAAVRDWDDWDHSKELELGYFLRNFVHLFAAEFHNYYELQDALNMYGHTEEFGEDEISWERSDGHNEEDVPTSYYDRSCYCYDSDCGASNDSGDGYESDPDCYMMKKMGEEEWKAELKRRQEGDAQISSSEGED